MAQRYLFLELIQDAFWVQNCKNDGFTKKKKKRLRDPEKAVLIISYPSNTVIHTFLFIRDKY